MGSLIKNSSTNHANSIALAAKCRVNDTLRFIGKRWMMAILYEISTGNNQFSSLRKSLDSISDHILGSRVSDLFGEGLIVKQEIENNGPSLIMYSVTQKGEELLHIMQCLHQWGSDTSN